jgi:hypothetical protein
MVEALIYVVCIAGGGFMAGHWLTMARYERRFRLGIGWQKRREERIAEMDRLDAIALDDAVRRAEGAL